MMKMHKDMNEMTVAEMRRDVMDFVREYPTMSTLRMQSLAVNGIISWEDAYKLSVNAMAAALNETSPRANKSHPH